MDALEDYDFPVGRPRMQEMALLLRSLASNDFSPSANKYGIHAIISEFEDALARVLECEESEIEQHDEELAREQDGKGYGSEKLGEGPAMEMSSSLVFDPQYHRKGDKVSPSRLLTAP